MFEGQTRSSDFCRSAKYVDKILKGAKSADLPVEQPTKFELVMNFKAAPNQILELGLGDPDGILRRLERAIDGPFQS